MIIHKGSFTYCKCLYFKEMITLVFYLFLKKKYIKKEVCRVNNKGDKKKKTKRQNISHILNLNFVNKNLTNKIFNKEKLF